MSSPDDIARKLAHEHEADHGRCVFVIGKNRHTTGCADLAIRLRPVLARVRADALEEAAVASMHPWAAERILALNEAPMEGAKQKLSALMKHRLDSADDVTG